MHHVKNLMVMLISAFIVASAASAFAGDMNAASVFYEGDRDLSQTPQSYIEESAAIYKSCEDTEKLRRNHKCKCYATEYLNKRIEQGQSASQESLLIALRDSCRNVEATTHQQYVSCMGESYDTSALGKNVTKEAYCTCVADEWKQSYSSFQGKIHSSVIQREMSFAAIMACKKKLSQY